MGTLPQIMDVRVFHPSTDSAGRGRITYGPSPYPARRWSSSLVLSMNGSGRLNSPLYWLRNSRASDVVWACYDVFGTPLGTRGWVSRTIDTPGLTRSLISAHRSNNMVGTPGEAIAWPESPAECIGDSWGAKSDTPEHHMPDTENIPFGPCGNPRSMWGRYRETFPVRYLRYGHFDQVVMAWARGLPGDDEGIVALDVGGGTSGTSALLHAAVFGRVLALDPFCGAIPAWQRETSWAGLGRESKQCRIMLVVMRGSFNYLSGSDIRQAALALAPGGVLLANTFLSPPDGVRSRPYRDLNGGTGLEVVEYHPHSGGGTVVHRLIPDPGAPGILDASEIRHEIPYRDQSWILSHLPGATIDPYGSNSALITWVRR